MTGCKIIEVRTEILQHNRKEKVTKVQESNYIRAAKYISKADKTETFFMNIM